MGLLSNYVTKTIPQNARNLWGEIKRAPSDIAGLFSQQTPEQLNQLLNTRALANPEQWINAGMELSGMAPVGGLLAHTVYHGSPHKFTKVDMSKMGTGEGAQMYGKGFYTAEHPDVAMTYQPRDTGMEELLMRKYSQAEQKGQYPAMEVYENFLLHKTPMEVEQQIAESTYKGAELKQMQDALEYAKKQYFNQRSGALYKMDIPDESLPKMIDYDKTIKEQPLIYEMLKKAGFGNLDSPGVTGAFYAPNTLEQLNELRKAGIPGLRYLDQGSRNEGVGTSNFVLFDDQLPRILEINGQPTGLLSYADEAKKVKKK